MQSHLPRLFAALYPGLIFSGVLMICLLIYHERYIAEYPLIPTRLCNERTVMAGCCLGAFHFFCQFSYESYFPSYLQVVLNHTARDASYISQSYVFSATIAALICGALVNWSRRYKMWMVLGILIHMVGAVMMVRFRSLHTSTFELVMSQVSGSTDRSLIVNVSSAFVPDAQLTSSLLIGLTRLTVHIGHRRPRRRLHDPGRPAWCPSGS